MKETRVTLEKKLEHLERNFQNIDHTVAAIINRVRMELKTLRARVEELEKQSSTIDKPLLSTLALVDGAFWLSTLSVSAQSYV